MKFIKHAKENNLYLLRILFNQMPQKLIAQQMGISQSFYCKLEKGMLPVSSEMINRLSGVYQTDIQELIFLPKYELWRRLLLEKPLKQYSLAHKVDMEAFQIRRKFVTLS
ncbi:MAG: helix-turn-helix transcriptional regulator [Chitinophagaceae bacterium]|nr:helix-turn-helix transcriptional regulator [Chitinophagaceae bacterium]